MLYIIRFAIVWACWFLFADKKRWREIFPVCIFAGYLAGILAVITTHYPLWSYSGAFHPVIPNLLDLIGIYIVVTYLFIQWLPRQPTKRKMARYWFYWTTIAITIEWIHVHLGKMHYGLWWNIGWSYMADWILFTVFYWFHKAFKLAKLSE